MKEIIGDIIGAISLVIIAVGLFVLVPLFFTYPNGDQTDGKNNYLDGIGRR